jgi:mitochondrial fission protein ELM1
MSQRLHLIRVLSDGRPGHANQGVGLAAALARRTGAEVQTISLPEHPLLWVQRFPLAVAGANHGRQPDLLIGVGHRTHLPMLFAARRFTSPAVVIMRPTWPMRWFDLCLVPSHDLPARCVASNVVATRGALNRIPENIPSKQARGVVLIGGPSKHFGWDATTLRAAIQAVVQARPELDWIVGDSRRTPADFLPALAKTGMRAQLVAHAQTTPEWLPTQLLAAEEVWVTEESISMLHEAVTAGARTGMLPMPQRVKDSRPLRAVRGLVADGYVTPFAQWMQGDRQLPAPKRLHETARCAEVILKRFFPGAVAGGVAG